MLWCTGAASGCITVPEGKSVYITKPCPAGHVATGGGVRPLIALVNPPEGSLILDGEVRPYQSFVIHSSAPVTTAGKPTGWSILVGKSGAGSLTFHIV